MAKKQGGLNLENQNGRSALFSDTGPSEIATEDSSVAEVRSPVVEPDDTPARIRTTVTLSQDTMSILKYLKWKGSVTGGTDTFGELLDEGIEALISRSDIVIPDDILV